MAARVGGGQGYLAETERRARYGEVMRLYRGDGRRTTRYAPGAIFHLEPPMTSHCRE